MSDEDEGEKPSEVWFQNQQWPVTDYGVESVVPGAPYHYHFDKTRLLETGDRGEELYDWPLQMAEKTWVDINAFIEVFVKALELHAGSYKGKVDEAMLEKSIERARESTRH